MPGLGLGPGHSNPRPAWVAPGARLDLDFENERYWDGRVRSVPEAVEAWSGGAPVLDASGLVCDGSHAWMIGPLAGLAAAGTHLAVRVELTETPGALDPGYLAILHAGGLANRLALLSTRTGLSSRLTVDGQEVFTRTINLAGEGRYRAMLGVKSNSAFLEKEGAARLSGSVVPAAALPSLEIGGFNASLPLKGCVHRLTLWAGLTAPSGDPASV